MMSEFTRCSYCTLKSLTLRAKATGKEVTVKANQHKGHGKFKDLMKNGVDVFVHGVGAEPDKDDFVCWVMALSDHCVC